MKQNQLTPCTGPAGNRSLSKSRAVQRRVLVAALTAAALLPTFGSLAAEETISHAPPIREVTVYPDRALIRRSGPVKLPAGKVRLVFRDGAPGLERDSLRAFSGDKQVIVQGIASYLERSAVTINKDVRALEADLEKLDRERDRLRLVRDRLRRDLSGIKRYYAHLKKALSEQSAMSGKGGDGAAAWERARGFLLRRRLASQKRLQSADEKLRDLAEQRRVAQRKLRELRTGLEKTRRIVEISVRVAKPVTTEVGFSYRIRGAGWGVSYGVHLASPDKVDVDYYGNVWQKTGEDWPKVKLSLSVAQPALGAERPKLAPLRVAGVVAKTKQVIVMKDEKEKEEEPGDKPATGTSTTEGQFTGLKSEGSSLVFQIRRPISLRSASRRRRVTIARFSVKPRDIHHRIVGERRRAAYLAARLPNTQSFPMMAGPADIFRSSGFIGRSKIGYTPSGSQFLVGFGLERSLRVRRNVSRREKSSGLLSSDRLFRTSLRIRVSNPGSTARRVSIFERLPVSELEEVSVKVLPETTAGSKETRKGSGLLRWTYDLAPGQSKLVRLVYEVQVPKRLGLRVYGR